MPELDIWELDDQHSTSTPTPPTADNRSTDGGLATTSSGDTTGGPFVAAIEASSWSREDVEIALELAQLVVYVALAYAVLTDS